MQSKLTTMPAGLLLSLPIKTLQQLGDEHGETCKLLLLHLCLPLTHDCLLSLVL